MIGQAVDKLVITAPSALPSDGRAREIEQARITVDALMTQSKAGAPARRRARDQGARDAFVVVAMTFVVAALGLGLYMQFAIGFWLALLVALLTYAALITAHVLVRKGQVVAELEAELATLRAQLAATPVRETQPRPAMDGRPQPRLGPSSGEASALPSGAPAGQPEAPERETWGPGGMRRMGPMPPAPPEPAPAFATRPADIASPYAAGQDRAPTARPFETGRPPMPGMPPHGPSAAIRPALDAATDAGRAETYGSHAPMRSAPAMPLAPRGIEPSTVTHMTGVIRPAGQLDGPSPAADAAPDTVVSMKPYWAVRPGAHREPGASWPAEPALRLETAPGSHPPVEAMREHPSPPSAEPMAAAHTAVAHEAPVAASPDSRPQQDSDLDAMQVLIKQLATQLSAPRSEIENATQPTNSEVGGDADDVVRDDVARDDVAVDTTDRDEQLAQSIAALTHAAAQMNTHEHRDQPFDRPMPTDVAPAATPPEAVPPASPYARLAKVAEAVTADRLDVYLDPIRGLDDRKARHFEVSVRLHIDDEEPETAEALHSLLAGTGLIARIDAAKLQRSAAVAGRLSNRGTNASLFANLSQESLSDNHFLDAFADTFADNAAACARLVISLMQSEVRTFTDTHWDSILAMSDLGIRFALEDVADLDMDFEALEASGFEFIKLDAAVFLDGMPIAGGVIPSTDICRHLKGLGLIPIVSGIGDETLLARVMGLGASLGQGSLFGAPQPVRIEPERNAA